MSHCKEMEMSFQGSQLLSWVWVVLGSALVPWKMQLPPLKLTACKSAVEKAPWIASDEISRFLLGFCRRLLLGWMGRKCEVLGDFRGDIFLGIMGSLLPKIHPTFRRKRSKKGVDEAPSRCCRCSNISSSTHSSPPIGMELIPHNG